MSINENRYYVDYLLIKLINWFDFHKYDLLISLNTLLEYFC